jgi:hypothetical protein
VHWQIEQAEEFRQDVEQYTDAERAVLAGAYQALLHYGPLPHPGSPLEIHRLRDPRAGDAYVLVLNRPGFGGDSGGWFRPRWLPPVDGSR